MATAVHNNWVNSTTGLSPSQILIGYKPSLSPSEKITTGNEAAEKQVEHMEKGRQEATKVINKKVGQTPLAQYKTGDLVWLKGTHLKLPHQVSKLAPKQYRPFKITKEMSPVAYQLDLPGAWQIHPVFHALLLSPYTEMKTHGPNYSRPPPDLIRGEEFFEVEQIRSHQHHG
jgi:hypothetical protein